MQQRQEAPLIDRLGEHLNSGLARTFRFMGLDEEEVAGRGSTLYTRSGAEYLDLGSGYGVHILGYMHPKVVEAARRQLSEGLALSSRVLLTRPQVDLAERLAELLPGDLSYAFFVSSGTEAVEAALKFSRLATGRATLVATTGAFHGKTMGSLSLSGREVYRQPVAPLLPGIRHVPFGDAGAAEAAIDRHTAAMVVEPIQGEGGVVIPPDDYLPRLRAACDRVGALLVVDEVQAGMGRTGKFLATEHSGVVPDLVCLAKGLGGGIVPIGAVVGTARAFAFFDERPLIHTSTFGGGPLACTVAVAALQAIEEEELVERARRLGEPALERLKALGQRYPEVIADVRGRGLMIGLEMRRPGMAGMVLKQLFDEHILAIHTLNNERVIRLLPPLVIEPAELDRGVAAVERAVAETAAMAADLMEEGAIEEAVRDA